MMVNWHMWVTEDSVSVVFGQLTEHLDEFFAHVRYSWVAVLFRRYAYDVGFKIYVFPF